MVDKLLEYVPMLLHWVEQFMSHTPTSGRGEIEFRRYVCVMEALNYDTLMYDRTPNCQEDNQWVKSCYVSISGVRDIEECVWSPR